MELKQIIAIISLLTVSCVNVCGYKDTLDFRISVSADVETVEHYGGREVFAGKLDTLFQKVNMNWNGRDSMNFNKMEIEYNGVKIYEWLPEYKVQNIDFITLSGDSLQEETVLRMHFDM